MMYFLTYGGMGGPISSDGQTNDYWNAGVVIYFVDVISHHIMIFAETRDWNPMIMSFYTCSFALLFLVVQFNEVFPMSVYRGNQWSMILASPITWLMIIIQCFVIYGPRYVIKNLSDVVWHPEFAKIKGA
jgi:hypothetical protein